MKKVIFFDVDNTLICREQNHICDSTLTAIEMCKDNGVEVAIATGRSLAMLRQEGIDQLAEIVIASNGGVVSRNGEVLYHSPMNHQSVQALVKVFEAKGMPYVVHKHHKSVSSLQHEWTTLLSNRYNMTFEYNEDGLDEIIYHLNARIMPESIPDIEKQFTEFRFVPLVDISEGYDIFNQGLSKATGIRYIKQLYRDEACKYYCFGDGFNDLEMFEEVDCSIAMGNGCEPLKQKATYVTDSVDNKGIYNALKKLNII